MQQGTDYHKTLEGPIYDELSLYKVVETNKGRPVIVHLDGSTSTIVPFESINANSFEEEDFVALFDRIKTVVEDLDHEEISVQFVMKRQAAEVGLEKISHLPTYLKPRATFLKNLSENNQLFENKYYLAVHCQNKIQRSEKEGMIEFIVNRIKQRTNTLFNLNKSMENIDRRLSKVLETTDSLTQLLDQIGSSFRVLKSKQEYYDIIQEFTRPDKSKVDKIEVDASTEKFESPRSAMFAGVRADVKKEYFTLDNYFHRLYTLDRAPRKVITGKSISALDSLPMEFFYSVTFRKMGYEETKNKFKFALASARMLQGSNEDSIVEDRTLDANTERISDHYDTFAFGDSSGVEVSCNLVFRIKESFLDRMQKEDQVSRKELLRRLDQAMHKSVFASFGNSSWINEPHSGWQVFNRIIPGFSSAYNIYLKKIVLVSNDLPYFLSIYDSKMRGVFHNGTNHFIDMKDNLVTFELMWKKLPAWNYSISGQTGSGKSVLMNAILTMQFADAADGKPPTICILDVGGDRGSYSKFMDLVKGTKINLSGSVKPKIQMLEIEPQRSKPSINRRKQLAKFFLNEKVNNKVIKKPAKKEEEDLMTKLDLEIIAYYDSLLNLGAEKTNDKARRRIFEECFEGLKFKDDYLKELELKEGQCIPDQNRLNMIMSLMEVILSSSDKDMDGFISFDPDEVSQTILETYEIIGEREGRFPRISDLYNVTKETRDEEKPATRKFLSKIQNWTVNGQYPMFDQPTNVDMTNNVILADMKGVESQPKLQMMYTLLISQMFSDKMYFGRGRKMIIRDEAWSLMKNARAREFFVEDLRTARKNGFATVALSQLPTDYLSPDEQVGRAIMSNMQVNIFCKFEGEAVCRTVATEYNLNEEVYKEMTTLGVHTKTGADGVPKPDFAKFMMLVGRDVYLLKNKLHPFEYALYSSSADDNEIIDYYRFHAPEDQKIEDLESVLWHIAEGRHKGDEGLIAYLEYEGYKAIARQIRGG